MFFSTSVFANGNINFRNWVIEMELHIPREAVWGHGPTLTDKLRNTNPPLVLLFT